MFLNRLRQGLLAINKVSVISFIENRFTHYPVSNTNPALYDIRKCEIIWKTDKNSDRFFQHLSNCFSENKGSPAYISNIMKLACQDCNCSSDLVYHLISAYNQYLETSSAQSTITKEQKTEILNCILNYKDYPLLKLACDVFKITSEQKSSFKELINELLHHDKLAEAAYCISILKLQEEFPIERVVLLLLHGGKWSETMSFLSNFPDLHYKTAKFLDNLLDEKTNSVNASVSVRRVYRALNFIVKTYKIPLVECKNLHLIKSKGALNMLIKRREQQSISETTWEDMVLKIIGDNRDLKEALLYKLVCRGDKSTAIRMQEKLQMFDFDLSTIAVKISRESLKKASDELNDFEDLDDEKETEPGHLSFDSSLSDIKFIDTKESYLKCVLDLSQNYKMIGIDTEWKPHFGLSADRLALIQLAAIDKVYILDVLALNNCLDASDWDKLMEDIFSNTGIIKLGCAIVTDIQMIVRNNQGTKGKVLRFSHILDMAVFYQKLQGVYPSEMDKDEDSQSLKGLSNLCKIILGKPLSKEERLCDWEKRPLTKSQLEYAALDAHCLLHMYDELRRICLEKDMNFDHLAKVAIVLTTSLWKPKKKSKIIKQGKDIRRINPIPVHLFKVVVQPELELHVQNLKKIGADVYVLQHCDKASDAALISKSQGRILLCLEDFKEKVHNIASDVPIFAVFQDSETQLSIPRLINKYSVILNSKNLSNQCEVCSSKNILQLSPEDLNWIKHQESEVGIREENEESSHRSVLQRTIAEMNKAGVKLKLNKLNNISRHNILLCTKCGNLQ